MTPVTCDYCGGPHTRRDCGRPSDAECGALVAALAKVLPPALVPPTSTVREWVGASFAAAEKWAASELQARQDGGTVTQPPRDLQDWIRWGISEDRDKLLNVLACAKQLLASTSTERSLARRELEHAVNKTRPGC